MEDRQIGIGFVGAGLVAHMHARAVAACAGARLVGMFDSDHAKAQTMALQYGGNAYRSLDELLSDPAIEAVHVLTPPAGHVAATVASLEAGKHVLVEKPVADNIEDIRKMQAAATKHDRLCMPAHNYIYVPSLRRAKRLIEQNKLGRLSSFWMIFNMYHGPELVRKYGSILRVAMVHHAYSLLYLLGRPRRLIAVSRQTDGIATQVAITCQMPDDVIANLWASFDAKDLTNDPWSVVYKVLGSAGGVCYSWNEAQFEDDTGPGFGLPSYEDGFRGEVDHFVNHCIRRGEAPLSTMDDAADALRLIEAAEASAEQNRRGPDISF